MKKIIYIIILVFGFQASQAQIKRYKPQSYKDSFLEWLEIGAGGYYGKVQDKQYASSNNTEVKGFAIDARIKMKDKFFFHFNYEIGLPGYDDDLINSAYFNYEPFNYLFRSEFSKIQGGVGYYFIGHHKSTFAFAPIAPSFGTLSYKIRVNYYINNNYVKDGEQSGTQFGVGNLSTMRLRIGKFQFYSSFYMFTSLKNSNNFTAFIDHFESDEFEPQFFMYTAQFGIQFRL